MLLEYLEDLDSQPQTRVLLLYDLAPAAVQALREAVDRLSRGKPGDELRVMRCRVSPRLIGLRS
jgi:hypothetical protein